MPSPCEVLSVVTFVVVSSVGLVEVSFALFITLGLNKGEKFSEFNEVEYANRVCLAVDEKHKSIIMFEPDLKAGDEVQLMLRSINLNYIEKGITSLKLKAKAKPLYYLFIFC